MACRLVERRERLLDAAPTCARRPPWPAPSPSIPPPAGRRGARRPRRPALGPADSSSAATPPAPRRCRRRAPRWPRVTSSRQPVARTSTSPVRASRRRGTAGSLACASPGPGARPARPPERSGRGRGGGLLGRFGELDAGLGADDAGQLDRRGAGSPRPRGRRSSCRRAPSGSSSVDHDDLAGPELLVQDLLDSGSSTRRWMARRSGRAPSWGS